MLSKEVVWLGDARRVLVDFPDKVREDLGWNLWQLQKGEVPANSRPMPTIAPGVFELKESDDSSWYRVVYYVRLKNKILVLHCFTKKSRKTDQRDLDLAAQRLRKFLLEYQL